MKRLFEILSHFVCLANHFWLIIRLTNVDTCVSVCMCMHIRGYVRVQAPVCVCVFKPYINVCVCMNMYMLNYHSKCIFLDCGACTNQGKETRVGLICVGSRKVIALIWLLFTRHSTPLQIQQ